jgi:hypothetical protein
MTKIKHLCGEFSLSPYPQHPLDNFAVELFDTKRYDVYHQSQRPIDEHWGIPVDRKLLTHANSEVLDFDKLGPNEKYVTNKILNAPSSSLLMIVGDLGVGKTGFSMYFLSHILPHLIHKKNITRTINCPLPIYLDFQRDTTFPSDFASARQEFSDRFCDKLAARISNIIPLREEITTTWDAILQHDGDTDNRHASNAALDYIRNRIRLDEVGTGVTLDEAVYQKRLTIRKGVDERKYRLQYFGALLRYIQRTHFAGHEKCLLVLVDNIDPEPAIVQHAAMLVLKQFTGLGGVRVVATVRHTTYHQQFSDKGADAPDAAPFCAIEPLEIVAHRIEAFLADGDRYRQHVAAEAFEAVRAGINRLKHEVIAKEAFKSLFSSLVGHSIRRGLLLAQNLIVNSEYDLAELGRSATNTLHITSALRALMVGANGVYEWNRASLIENVFDVQAQPGTSHLIKLRILKAVAVATRDGLSISALNGLMDAFHYPAPLMCAAVGEMIEEPRGLLWCDTDLRYDNFVEIISHHSHARLHLTPTGKGYESTLFKKLDYIQEVMLDTDVDPHQPTSFGSGWNYGRLEDRFSLVFEFARRLFIEDRKDMQTFVEYNDPRQFRSRLGVYGLITKQIVDGIRETARRILDAAVKGRTDDREMSEFRDKHLSGYNYLHQQAEEFERQSL